VTFTLEGFTKQQQNNAVLTTGFTAAVNATMTVGQLTDTVTVTGEAPTVDVQNARQVAMFEGEAIRGLPTHAQHPDADAGAHSVGLWRGLRGRSRQAHATWSS
jgi:hypothetical protein